MRLASRSSRKPAAGTGKGGAPYEVSTEWGAVREGAATPSAPAARSQSSVGTKVAFRESAACRTAVSLVVMRSRPAGSAPLFVPGGKAFCRSKLARPRETPAEVGPVSQEAGLAAVAQHEQHDSSSRSTRSAAARAFSMTMAAQKWGDKEGAGSPASHKSRVVCGGPH